MTFHVTGPEGNADLVEITHRRIPAAHAHMVPCSGRYPVCVNAAPLWPAPVAGGPVQGEVSVPGSKSATNRALVLAALATGRSHIRKPLHARDTRLMAAALRALGTRIDEVPTEDGDIDWVVHPGELRGPATIDCGLAGTVMRFVPPVAALARGPVTFDGDERARVRPMRTIIEALRALGVEIDDAGSGTLPFTLHGHGAVGRDHVIVDASASSQFVSALLLAAARFEQGCTIEHRGPAIPSMPHLDMTVDMLRKRGVHVLVDTEDPTNARWVVSPGPIAALDDLIEPDLSNAAPFLAAAMVTGGTVTVRDWPEETTQPGDRLRELFAAMFDDIELMPAEHQEAARRMEAAEGRAGRARAVADYIAGMTDRYAIREYGRLFDPSERT